MDRGKPYQYPPADFQPGDRVRYEGQTYTVFVSSHTHSQLEGLKWAVANWQLKRVKSRRQSPTPKK